MNSMQKMFFVVVLMLAFSAFLAVENFQYKNAVKEYRQTIQEMTAQKANCTDLGICVGDVVIPTDDAMKKLNQTYMKEIQYGAVVKRVDTKTNVLTIDKGNENYDYLTDVWVKKKTAPLTNTYTTINIEVVGAQQSYCDESGCSEVLGSYQSFRDSSNYFQYEYDVPPGRTQYMIDVAQEMRISYPMQKDPDLGRLYYDMYFNDTYFNETIRGVKAGQE